jgi:hypothetical protein
MAKVQLRRSRFSQTFLPEYPYNLAPWFVALGLSLPLPYRLGLVRLEPVL